MTTYEELKAQYDRTFADHRLDMALNNGKFRGYYLRPKEGGRINSVLILFTPEGITITGDHAPGRNGVCSDFGYDQAWFSKEKGAEYLAVKFGLRKEYQWELAEAYIEERIAKLGEPTDKNTADLYNWNELLEDVRGDLEAYDFYARLQEMEVEEFYDVAKAYDPRELANLAAIQHAFARLMATTDEIKEAAAQQA